MRSAQSEKRMQMRLYALFMSPAAVSLLSSRASQDIHKLNKVVESMNI